MKRLIATVGILATALVGCGSPVAGTGRTSASAPSSSRGGPAVLLDVTNTTIGGLQSQVFNTSSPWDLMYEYDCSAIGTDFAGTFTAGISVTPKGEGIFGGHLVVDATSGEGAGIVEGLAPGSFSLVVDIGYPTCPWRVVAGRELGTDRLPPASWLAAPSPGTKPEIATDSQGRSEQGFPLVAGSHLNLLYAYDCGSAQNHVETNVSFGILLNDEDPAHFEGGSVVSLDAPRGWGILGSLPDVSNAGYVPPPGSLSLDVYSNCRWHVIVGRNLAVGRPAIST